MHPDEPRPCARPVRRAQGSIFHRALALLLLTAILAGCSGLKLPDFFTPASPTPTLQPTAGVTPSPEASPTPDAQAQALTLWLPPRFDPQNSGAAGKLLAARLESFAAQNPGVSITVRIKAETGTASLINSLAAAAPAAPGALPSLVALTHNDLQTAALKGLIFPLDDYSQGTRLLDWYGYARDLSQLQGGTLGLPFAGDALVLLYRPARTGALADTWTGLMQQGVPLVFAAGDPQALVTLALYRSADGLSADTQQRPILQAEPLAEVLQLYQDGAANGTFPAWLPTITSSEQAWQAYTDQRVHISAAWSSAYLGSLPADTNLALLPGLKRPATLASGWLWCLSDPNPARRELAVRLMEYLTEPEFMGEWTSAAGYLPARAKALAEWKDQSLRATVNQIVVSAQAQPPSDQLYTLGPVLENAAVQVLRQQVTPAQAAQMAAEPFISK